jgi:hypothetical protein
MGIAIAIATIVGAAAAVVGLFIPWLNTKLSSRKAVVVRRISTPSDPNLLPALALYTRSIPENERDSQDDIVRWLEEVAIETKEGRCKLKDYFLVAIVGNRIAGLLYSQYYANSRLLFISFMAVDPNIHEARRCLASTALLHHMSRELHTGLKNCEGLIFEIEYSKTSNKKRDATSRARARHFRALARMQGIVVKQIEIDYKQPKLSLWDGGHSEERLHLMYGRTKSPHLSATVPKSEVEKVLGFLYNEIYGDAFEDDPKRDSQYRHYLTALCQRTLKHMPEMIVVS